MAARVVIGAPDGPSFEAALDEDLLEVLQRNGYPISTSCGGIASCGLCRLSVVEGKDNLTPIKPQEIGHLGNVAKVIGLRLACQSKIVSEGVIVVRVPEVDDVEEKKRKKADRLRAERRPARAARTGPNAPPGLGDEAPSPTDSDQATDEAPSPTDSDQATDRFRIKLPVAGPRAPRTDLIEWRPRVLKGPKDPPAGSQ